MSKHIVTLEDLKEQLIELSRKRGEVVKLSIGTIPPGIGAVFHISLWNKDGEIISKHTDNIESGINILIGYAMGKD